MTGRGRTRKTSPSEAVQYRQVAISLLESAHALHDLARAGDRYGNAIGVLAVHAAIAWADALAIAYGGLKSTDAHERAADLLSDVLAARSDVAKIRLLAAVIGEKDQVSYAGDYFTVADATKLLKKATQFAEWAEALYQKRPPAQ